MFVLNPDRGLYIWVLFWVLLLIFLFEAVNFCSVWCSSSLSVFPQIDGMDWPLRERREKEWVSFRLVILQYTGKLCWKCIPFYLLGAGHLTKLKGKKKSNLCNSLLQGRVLSRCRKDRWLPAYSGRLRFRVWLSALLVDRWQRIQSLWNSLAINVEASWIFMPAS